MSRQRKRDAVLRLLRGEDLDTVSRALGLTAATLSGWREAFLEGGEARLASKPIDGEERESDRLKARLGEMLLERELLTRGVPETEFHIVYRYGGTTWATYRRHVRRRWRSIRRIRGQGQIRPIRLKAGFLNGALSYYKILAELHGDWSASKAS
jgi:transposase-like protein